MVANSSIEWCHHTFNPWWGCVEVSAECDECYARTFARRVGHAVWGVEAPRRFFGDAHWAEPLKWNAAAAKAGERHRVFCASMADVFEFRPDLNDARARLFALIEATPNLDWLLLTKRPEQMPRLAPATWQSGWPVNAWAGTTTGTRETLELRVPRLRQVPAAIRFLSCEPLLEDVFEQPFDLSGIRWGILGGESGKARPCDVQWIRNGITAFRAFGLAALVKQLGARPVRRCQRCQHPFEGQCRLFGKDGHGMDGLLPLHLSDRKGGDINEFPADLRVRQFPEVRA